MPDEKKQRREEERMEESDDMWGQISVSGEDHIRYFGLYGNTYICITTDGSKVVRDVENDIF